MYYLCEKSYKPLTVQYSTSDCVSLVPRLTLLDFMNKLDLSTCSRNRMRSYVWDILWSDHFILSMTKVRLERLSWLRPWYRLVAEAEPGFSSWFMTCYQRAGWSKPPIWYLAYVSCVLLVCACELDLVYITTLCTRGWDLLHLRHRIRCAETLAALSASHSSEVAELGWAPRQPGCGVSAHRHDTMTSLHVSAGRDLNFDLSSAHCWQQHQQIKAPSNNS